MIIFIVVTDRNREMEDGGQTWASRPASFID